MRQKYIVIIFYIVLFAGSAFGLIPETLSARQVFQADTDTTLSLEEIIITASGMPTTRRETIKPTLVIHKPEIQRYEGIGLGQLLHAQAGLYISNAYGAPAENRRLKVQGAGDAYTLLLLDGVVLGDPSSINSLFDLRLLSLSDVRRIEIVKGSQSTLYGTDAIGGVINIITEKPDSRGETSSIFESGNLVISADQYAARKVSAGLTGRVTPKFTYRLNLAGDYTEGFSSAATPEEEEDLPDRTPYDKDGHQFTQLNGTLKANLSDTNSLDLMVRQGWYRGDFDGGAFLDAPNRYRSDFIFTGIQHQYEGDFLSWQTGYHGTFTKRQFDILNTFSNETDVYPYQGAQHQIKSTAAMRINPKIKMLVGAEGIHYVSPSTPQANRADASIFSAYANSIHTLSDLLLVEGGVRWNVHNEFGSQWTYSLATRVRPEVPFQISAGLSSGYKAPTLDQLYGQFGANPNLRPQDSMYLFASVDGSLDRFGLHVHGQVFQRKIRQLIQYDFQQGYVNRNREEVLGVETSVELRAVRNWIFTLSGSYLQGDLYLESSNDIDVENREDLFVLIPEHQWKMVAHWDASDALFFRFEMELSSSRTDLFFNSTTFTTESVTLDAYQLVHLYGEYRMQRFSLFGSVSNVLDQRITEVYGYNSYGRNITMGLRVKY